MSVKESEVLDTLPHDERRNTLHPNTKTSTAQSKGHRFSKSTSLDIADSNTSDLQRTKAAYEDRISGKNSSTPNQLRKTISCGGINVPSKSKVVLRRWTSVLDDREENFSKRHSSSALHQGSREKILFRPVSSILLSTPWEKDFKGNVSKVGPDHGRKAEDVAKINKRHDTEKESLANPNSCSINKQERSKVSGTGNEISYSTSALPSSRGASGSIKVSSTSENQAKKHIDTSALTNEGYCIDTGEPINNKVPERPLSADIQVCKGNCELNERTAIPERVDNNSQIDKVLFNHNIYQKEKEDFISSGPDLNQTSFEKMPISTGSSYYYKSKYTSDFAANDPSYRRGNLSAYTRRAPETSYTNTFTLGRSLSTDKSGKETVAEVDAYISAYKSRRERSFDHVDAGYQAYSQSRAERKPSLDKPSPLYQSHAARAFPSGYTTNTLHSTLPASSNASETGRQRHALSRALEKDYSSGRPSRFLTKTDRSRSFDIDPIGYSSFTRTGSGGRFPRMAVSPTGSSSSASPPERETKDYSSEVVPTKGSILSSDSLTPSERAFFTTSTVPPGVHDDTTITRQRKSSLDSFRLSGLTTVTPKQRPLSLIGKLSQTASSGHDKHFRNSAVISTDYENDMSSRSRIMGGILSRFFTEEEPAKEVILSTDTTVNKGESEVPGSVEKNDQVTIMDDQFNVKSKVLSGEEDLTRRQIPISDGDSTSDVGSSPMMMSKDGIQSKPKNGQMVRVKSVFVEEGDTEVMGKDSSLNSAQKSKSSSNHGSKGLKEAKESEDTQQPRERHLSWLGRSLRKISSSSKTTSEEPLEKSEKPKRERRRSLLWRLGRESKSELVESVAEDSGAPDEIVVGKTYEAKEDRKGGKKEDRKGEKKEEKKEDKKEDKGIANYLRRSSRRKKSQVSEREILEARQETPTNLREEKLGTGQEIHQNSTEISQSETDVHSNDESEKLDSQLNEKPDKAPLAKAEDSDDDNMSSVSVRKSRFAEVLHQKEAAAKESQRSTAPSKRIDGGAKKGATNTTSSYLSSKFMKSRTIFEGNPVSCAGDERSGAELKKGTVSKLRPRRATQETADSSGLRGSAKVDAGKERFKAGIDEKRARFQKSSTSDTSSSPDVGRVPLRERNKGLLSSKAIKKDTDSEESSSKEAIRETDVAPKLPARRLASDSVVRLHSSELSGVEMSTRRGANDEVKTQNRRDQGTSIKSAISEKSGTDGNDIKKSAAFNVKEQNNLDITEGHVDKGLQETAVKDKSLLERISRNEAEASVLSRKHLSVNTDKPYEVSTTILEDRQKSCDEKSIKEVVRDGRNLGNDSDSEVKESSMKNDFDGEPSRVALCERQADIENVSDKRSVKEVSDEISDGKEIAGERIGSRRRRERRAHRMKQVDPQEIEKVKEQMRRDSTMNNLADGTKEDERKEGTPVVTDEKVEEEMPVVLNSDSSGLVEENNVDGVHITHGIQGKEFARISNATDEKLSETDTGDESTGSTGSATKLTTRSVIKDKIKQKKFDKQLRKERTMSLPIGVEVVITPPVEKKPDLNTEINGTRSPLLRTKPPIIPKIQRSQEADDIASFKKKTKRPMRSRPKTLTQGIDPSLLVSDIKAKEEAVVVEERLSISQLKQRLMQSESGSRTPRTPDVQRKNKRRSGKRYKTITEGIAPGLLEAAHQLAASEQDPNRLGVDHMNKLNMALSASTENLKRRSFIVSEVNSRIGSVGASLATSMEDLSMKENGQDEDKTGGSLVEESIKKLKKLPMVVDSDEDDPMPSVSSLKQKFLQAVEESYKPVKNKVSRRSKGRQRDRPFTISGLDDVTMLQLRHSIDERNERDREEKASENAGNVDTEVAKTEKMDEFAEDELEDMLKAEGLTADQLASDLGINPSLAQGSPLRARKPFLGTTTEESIDDGLEVIHETSEKQEKDPKPLGELRSKFMNAMSEFKSGSFDKETNADASMGPEEKEVNTTKRERRVGVVGAAEQISIELVGEDEPKSDLDFVSQNVTQLQSITDRRHLKPQRKQRSSANPVKTLQARGDLITEVGRNKMVESKDAQSQDGSKSVGVKLWRKVALANEAKAALQSTEDFSKVKLKKVKPPGQSMNGEPAAETSGVVESTITNLLLQIKGRRHVQIRIVEFDTASLSCDDSYVVVTPKELFCWHGKNANVIEKAKASEIASRINQKKEMGCKAFDVIYFEQDGPNDSKVFRTLGSQGAPVVKDDTEHDEDYERKMMNSSMVYSLQDSDPPELIPVYDMCQRSPSKEILKTDEVFVFDFVSEVYVWIGRQTPSGLRKKMMKLGRERFDLGYYKSPSSATLVHHGKSRKISLTATELPTRKQSVNRKLSVSKFLQDKENLLPRPSCAIFLSMFEGAEWVIFKEKFCDWPDESRIIRLKGGPAVVGEVTKAVRVTDVKPVDPLTMLTPNSQPHLPTFEGTEIDRGQGKPKGPDGFHIITRCVQVWHVTERSRTLLPQTSNGQFHSGEGFVIRWEYSIVASRVMKMLKDMEEAKAAGRHRCAYFFWLGNDCAVTEQGATAVMTVDLDEERGPHVRVIQGKEPPCFLNLFDGGMVIHAGKRKSKVDRATFSDRSVVRFYCVRNEVPSEACLLQVPVSASSLRSRSSFVLVLCKQGEIFLWHGSKSTDSTRATAIQAAHRLIENHPEEALLSEKDEIFLTEIDEGNEPEVFWVALGGEEYYGSLLSDLNDKWEFVPRCFHLSSATGQFIASEVSNPSINPKEVCPFPFLQDDLYDAYQPAIFIIDAMHEVYLWLGWWPEDEDSENSDAQRMRWDVDKKKAMESVLLYAKEAGRSSSHCYVVDAGLEPEQFINLFPYWIVQEDITEIQIEDGRVDSDKLQLITKKLEGFTREFFSIDELLQKPLPEGVNPSKLETYLSDEDFFTVFEMDREEFKNLPTWRRDNLKKSVGLY